MGNCEGENCLDGSSSIEINIIQLVCNVAIAITQCEQAFRVSLYRCYGYSYVKYILMYSVTCIGNTQSIIIAQCCRRRWPYCSYT